MKKAFRKFKSRLKDIAAINEQRKILPNFLKNAKGKKILLVSHQLTTTGSPLVLFRLAKELVNEGFSPLVLSYKGGSLAKSFEKIGVDVICGEIYAKNPEEMRKIGSNFDKVIANSIVCFPAVDVFPEAIWWIHEGQYVETCFMKDYPQLEEILRKAQTTFVVSDYALQTVKKYSPQAQIIKLGIEDDSAFLLEKTVKSPEIVSFSHVGNVTDCRAQDVLAGAIEKLDKKYLEQSEFHFFCEKKGRMFRKLHAQLESYPNVTFEGVLPHQDVKWKKFAASDVFIIPSRDESCSLVALEACMLSKPIVLSENVGGKYMVKEGENGFVIPTEDSDALREKIEFFIDNKGKLSQMGQVSREMYEKFASNELQLEEFKKIINLCKN